MVSDDLLRACSSSDNGTQNGKKKKVHYVPKLTIKHKDKKEFM